MYIYKVTNTINGKIYIGLCTNQPHESEDYLGSGVLILKAISKYGKENFRKEILEQGIENIQKLNEREIFWIEKHNSIDRNVGYNISEGGSGTKGVKKTLEEKERLRNLNLGKKQSTETIEKRAKKTRGLKRTEETRRKISTYYKNKFSDPSSHPMYGKKHSEETRKKMSESHKGIPGKIPSEETRKKMSESQKGKKLSKETKEKIGNLKRGVTGHLHSEETRKKMSESHKGKFSGPVKIECPYCGKIGSSNAMLRWHFDNCKNKE